MMMRSVRMWCRSCHRSFGSQKSLEGHARIHHASQRSKNRFSSPAAGAGEEGERPRCEVCGKSFGSGKSLNGHMRVHRGRHYGGFKNPRNGDSSSSSSSSLDQFDSLKSSLPSNWAATGKRGRKSTSTPEAGEVINEDKEAVQAADNLVFLSNSNGFKKSQSPQIDDHDDQEQRMMMMIKAEQMKVMEVEEEEEEEGDEKPMKKNLSQRSGNRYRCRFCSKIFLSGQALGGHMSAYVTRSKRCSSSQAANINCPGQTGNQVKKIVFPFDLNELPPMEEDEEVAVANGMNIVCSTSTHNNNNSDQ